MYQRIMKIFLGTSELSSVAKSDFNSDLEHYMYSYDYFAWNKFATAFIEEKNKLGGVL